MTTQYKEFIGKEPSLNQLYDFISSNIKSNLQKNMAGIIILVEI